MPTLDINMPSLLELDIEKPVAAKLVRHVLGLVRREIPKLAKVGPAEDQLRELVSLIQAGKLEVKFSHQDGALHIDWRMVGGTRWQKIMQLVSSTKAA